MILFETMQLGEGQIKRLAYHKARIKQSSKQFAYPFNDKLWDDTITSIEKQYPTQMKRIKLTLDESGKMDYQIFPLTTKNHFTAKLQCVSQHVPKAYVINKTSQREHLRHNHETDLILLYNEEGKILEFDIGNIVIKEDDQWYTPFYNDDFLRGTMRQYLLEQEKVKVKDYDIASFKYKVQPDLIEVMLITSLREVADVEIYL